MKKIAIIRAELAKDINESAKVIAAKANSQPQYVNVIRRKIKAELNNPQGTKRRPARGSPAPAVGIASLTPIAPTPKKNNFLDSENAKYNLIGALVLLVVVGVVIAIAR